jgi:serine/threonine-protein kinase HipA
VTEKKHKGKTVYNYFDNLLPDSLDIRKRIQAKFSAKTNQAFDLLSEIGRECVGAIQLISERKNLDVKKIEGRPLTDKEIANKLKRIKPLPLGMTDDDDFRISIAGAQEKTAFLWHNDQWHRPISTTPTTHIFKLPIGNIDLSDSVENEWLCMEIMRAFGLPVPKVNIKNFNDVKVLIVERFDRKFSEDGKWIIRLPQEDMCQANGVASELKHENKGGPGIEKIMNLLASSMQPQEYREQFMKTVFLFWILAAIDGHAKNFSIFLKQGGRFELTPVYDVISAYPIVKKKQLSLREIKMAMALRGKNKHYHWFEMMPRHWLEESKKVDFPETSMQKIIDESISKIDKVITEVSSRLPNDFPTDIAGSIFENMKKAAGKFS